VFRPGVAFSEDYERFYRRRHQGELQWAFHDDRQQVSEPLKVAYLFTKKRTGHPADSIAFVPSKDVETAKLILAALGFDEVPAFLDYALAEAKKTNFDTPGSRLLSIARSCPHKVTEDAFPAEGIGTINGGRGRRGRGQGYDADRPRPC
jgi:hypothetical protein